MIPTLVMALGTAIGLALMVALGRFAIERGLQARARRQLVAALPPHDTLIFVVWLGEEGRKEAGALGVTHKELVFRGLRGQERRWPLRELKGLSDKAQTSSLRRYQGVAPTFHLRFRARPSVDLVVMSQDRAALTTLHDRLRARVAG